MEVEFPLGASAEVISAAVQKAYAGVRHKYAECSSRYPNGCNSSTCSHWDGDTQDCCIPHDEYAGEPAGTVHATKVLVRDPTTGQYQYREVTYVRSH